MRLLLPSSTMNYDTILQTAISIAREAGGIVREAFPRTALAHIGFKGAVNPVTETDTAAEALIVTRLRAAFPDHRILAEEGGGDEWQARTRGWQVQGFPNIPIYHHRATGSAGGGLVKGSIEHGRAAYYMGYHPLFMLARGIRRMADRPLVLKGLGLLWGYFSDWLHRRERVDDPAMIRFLRQNQLRRLKLSRSAGTSSFPSRSTQ
ncbi:MAG TPA: hypothetical protein EYP10_01760 [Armatimonadetes bacterium]|nr:hypothetical protein [Armatimonadota bacterium]